MINVSDKIRIGIIGCGFIANQKHMPSLKRIDNVEMVAFCDLILDKAEAAKAKYGSADAKVYLDYKKLLEDKSIDVIHVCTPNRSHSFITVDALEAGKHVMCEKPMAINSAEAKKMIDAANRTGKTLTIGYQNRQRADVKALKAKIDEGALGDIYFARAIALRRRGVPDWGVFLNKYEQGGGPLIDIGTHALDLCLWFMDNYKPKMVLGNTFQKLNHPEFQPSDAKFNLDEFSVEDSAFGLVVMENGAVINIESSWAINMLDTGEAIAQLCGTKAGADFRDGIRINGVRNGERFVEKYDFAQYEAAMMNTITTPLGEDEEVESIGEATQWIDALVNGTKPCVLPEQAYTVTRILEGIYESAKTGEAVRLDK